MYKKRIFVILGEMSHFLYITFFPYLKNIRIPNWRPHMSPDNYISFNYEFSYLDNDYIVMYESKFSNITEVYPTDILVVSDTMVERFGHDSIWVDIQKKFKISQIVSFLNRGETYNISKQHASYIKHGGTIIRSNLFSNYHNNLKFNENESIVYNSSNFHTNFYSSLIMFPVFPLFHFFEDDSLTKNKLINEYDICAYTRYGYKEWRDECTDYVRKKVSESNLKFKEINNNYFKEPSSEIDISNYDDKKYILSQHFASGYKGLWHIKYFEDVHTSLINIVYETSLETEEIFLTEKHFKEFIYGMPCYIVCSQTIEDKLKEMGFFTFNQLYESDSTIEEIPNDMLRYGNIAIKRFKNFIDHLSSMSSDEIFNFVKEHEDKFFNNKKLMKKYYYEENKYRTELIDILLK